MSGIVGAALGWLFGGAPMDNGIDWEAKAASDEQRVRRQKLAWAEANGWRPWSGGYFGPPLSETPYDCERVWIWRLEWEFPSEADVRQLDPAMNVMGLLWKPWKVSDSHNLVAHNQTA